MAPRSVEMKRAHAVAAAWAPTRGRARKIAAAHLALKPHHVPRVPALHRIMILQRKKGSGLAGVTSRRARACCRASSARSAGRSEPSSLTRPCVRAHEPSTGSPKAANYGRRSYAGRLVPSGRGATLWVTVRRVESHDEDCHCVGSHLVYRGPATTHRPSRRSPSSGRRGATGQRRDLATGHRCSPQRTRHPHRRRVRSLVSHSGSARAGAVGDLSAAPCDPSKRKSK